MGAFRDFTVQWNVVEGRKKPELIERYKEAILEADLAKAELELLCEVVDRTKDQDVRIKIWGFLKNELLRKGISYVLGPMTHSLRKEFLSIMSASLTPDQLQTVEIRGVPKKHSSDFQSLECNVLAKDLYSRLKP